jgi:lysozyme family protein
VTEIDRILDLILSREGGWADHPHDRGGPTNMGITLPTLATWLAPQPAMVEDLRKLTRAEAREIYADLYVARPGYDKIEHEGLRAQVVDAGVLHGTGWATRCLQLVAGVTVDGILGPISLAAVNSSPSLGEEFFSRRVRKIGRIAQADQSQLPFLVGWLDRAVTVFLAERKTGVG